MKLRPFLLIAISTFSMSCKNSSEDGYPPPAVTQIQNLGTVGFLPAMGALSFVGIKSNSNPNLDYTGLTFDFTSENSVDLFGYAQSNDGSSQVCKTEIDLSQSDVSEIQNLLSQVPICEYTFPAGYDYYGPEGGATAIGIPIIPPSGVNSYLTANENPIIFNGLDTFDNPSLRPCDDTIINQVLNYLILKQPTPEEIKCTN